MGRRAELKKQMDYAMAHPEEVNKVAKVQSQARHGAGRQGGGAVGAGTKTRSAGTAAALCRWRR